MIRKNIQYLDKFYKELDNLLEQYEKLNTMDLSSKDISIFQSGLMITEQIEKIIFLIDFLENDRK